MNSDAEDYVLGEDVTSLAAPDSPCAEVDLVVSLSGEELAHLEAVADATEQSLSQIVRDALQEYFSAHHRGYTVSLLPISSLASGRSVRVTGTSPAAARSVAVLTS